VGFRIDPKPFAPQEYLTRMMTDRTFDLLVLSGSHGPDPDAMAARFGSAGSMQIMGYANADLDAVLGRGGMISDPAARAAAYYRAQDILAADLPIAPLFETVRTSVFRDGIRGLPHEDASGLVADYTFNLVRLRTTGADQSRKPES
jgi:ABC-type transport system substrate-binding protein